MDRRSFLAATTGLAAGVAGCAGEAEESTPTPESTVTQLSVAEQGHPGDICALDPVDVGIVPVIEPAFAADWSRVEDSRYGDLDDDDVVIGVERDGAARAYPIPVLFRHEVVNDRFGGPLLVTFCPICNSGLVAERRVGGEATAFGVSGQLWRPPDIRTRASERDDRVFGVRSGSADDVEVKNEGNLVMYDAATGSYWSQLLGQAICGPRTGDDLRIVPSATATWSEWRESHPDTEVLLPEPHSTAEHPPVAGDGPPDA